MKRWSAIRIVAAILFGAIVVGGFDAAYLRLFFADRKILGSHFTSLPDQHTPSYPRFLREVAARTEPGSSIAILVPMRHWNEGYAYAFYRASYFLAGRSVIPVVSPDDRAHLRRAADADYIAAWEVRTLIPEDQILWRGHDGFLARQKR